MLRFAVAWGFMQPMLDQVISELTRALGVDLSGYRRSMLQRRLEARMAVLRIREPGEYLDRLRSEPGEYERFLEAVSINVTSFFRNPVVWEILAQSVLPSLVEQKINVNQRELRVWSAGCASGEEAYTIAILLHDFLGPELADWKIHIFATDLSEEALRTATVGVYPRERLDHTKLGILGRYFTPNADGYEVLPFVRRMVWFSRDDLTSSRLAPVDSIYGTFDLVLCRNVLIYFARPLQDRVLDKLTRAMAPGGVLVLGESEVLDKPNHRDLKVIDRRNRIYQKTKEKTGHPKAAQTGEWTHA